MSTTQDKRTKVLILTAVLGLFALVIIIVGVFLFQQREVAPDDSDAAVEPVVSEWRAGDIWKHVNHRNKTETFTPPANFKKGTVKIEAQWGWSGGDCIVQVNETHEVIIPGLNKTIVMEDIGDSIDQAGCAQQIQELKDMGYPPGPFTFPHVVDSNDSTWFPKPPKSVTGEWDSSKGNLVINIKFTGLDGPPAVWCNLTNGTKKDEPICNGSHKYRVRVTWSAVEDTPTPSLTPTPTPSPTPTPTSTLTPTPSPTPEPLKASLGDFVWVDANRNGRQDAGESGLANVTVDLYTENGTTPTSTTKTDQDGKYGFLNINAGNYYVVFANVPGFSRTGANLGQDDADSDANTETGRTALITLTEGQTDNTWDAGYYSLNPAIQIIKSETSDHANATDFQIVPNAGTAIFHIRVTNTGEVDLKNVVVTDAMAPGCARNVSTTDLTSAPVGILVVGQSVNYSCQSTGVTESFENVAVVTGDPVEGGTKVTDEDDSAVTLAGTPAIRIKKSEQQDHSIAKDTQTIDKGGRAVFFITVTNIGAVDLKEVEVTDVLAPLCARDITGSGDLPATLKVGESVSFDCAVNEVETSFVNLVEVTGKSTETDEEVSDDDPSNVIVPGAILITKDSAMVCQADTSSTLTNTIEVSNPTNESRVVEVTDNLDSKVTEEMLSLGSISDGGVYNSSTGQIVWADVNLGPGESVTVSYTMTVPSADFGEFESYVVVNQDGVEVGRTPHTDNVLCLPATGILGDDTNRVVVPVVVILLGVIFVAFKGHVYVGNLLTKGKRDEQVFGD